MIYVAIIIIALAILIWNLDRVVDLKQKFGIGKKKGGSIVKNTFTVTINYHVSSVFNYNSQLFIALNLTIVNKTGQAIHIRNITVEPFHKAVNFDELRTEAEKVQHLDNVSLKRYKPIELEMGATQASSGFIMFETNMTECDIDRLIIKSDTDSQEILIKKELVHYDMVLPLQ